VDAIQLREKDLSDLALFEMAQRIQQSLTPPTRLIINSRPDVALAVGAAGVHLPAAGRPVVPVRHYPSQSLLLGRSPHSLEEVTAASDEGADYVVFGPVFPTPSKAGHRALPGIGGLQQATARPIPVLALGGVTIDSLEAICAAGAAGVAGIRIFHDMDRLASVVAAAKDLFSYDD